MSTTDGDASADEEIVSTEPFEVQVAFTPEGDPITLTGDEDVDLEGHTAELGYFIAPDEQGNGYATEAPDLCLVHVFD